MKKTTLFFVFLALAFSALHLAAQDKKDKKGKKAKKTEENIPVYNYTIDDPFDQFNAHIDSMNANRNFLYPAFFSYWPIDKNDTILKYDCYDYRHHYINMDTLHNINDVHSISFVKTYTDHTSTVIDAEGRPQSQIVVKTLYRYERTGPGKWKATDFVNNFSSILSEDQGVIVRSDSTYITNPATNAKQLTVRKYYRVEEIERTNTTELNPSLVDNNEMPGTAAVATVYTYNVPEFYFFVAKKNKDTTLQFYGYDYRDSVIPNIENYDSVQYFSLYKSYTDPTHTYDDNGQKKPLPVSSIIKRYDRMGREKWMSIEYPSNKYAELKEFRNVIVSTDSIKLVDPVNNHPIIKVFNYYKVIRN